MFRADRAQLADAVAWSVRAVPTKTSMPILLGLSLQVRGDRLTTSAFDYATSAQADVEVASTDDGQVLVPGRLLADICRSLPDAPVEVASDGGRVSVVCGTARFELPTLPVEDYPSLPDMPEVAGALESDVFTAAVGQVAIAAERGETLPTLSGVRVEIEGETVTLVATDRYRLAVRELRWRPQRTGLSVIALVPARTLADTAKSLAGTAEVTLALSTGASGEGLIGFSSAGRRTTSRLIEGEFPKYRSLLPDSPAAVALLATTTLTEAVKRVALVASRNRTAPVIRLSFDDDGVLLSAGTSDEAQASERLEASYAGEDMTVAFNPGYLLDGLGVIDTDMVQIGFTTTTKPAVLTGKGSEVDYRYVIMPVRIAG